MQETSDSSSGTKYKMLDTQSSSATVEDITVLFKNKLRKEGFVTHEIEYMTRNGFKKLRTSKRRSYPFS
jgi:hypothetical protein